MPLALAAAHPHNSAATPFSSPTDASYKVVEAVAPHPDILKGVESCSAPGRWWPGSPCRRLTTFPSALYQFYWHAGMNELVLRMVGHTLPTALHGLARMVALMTYSGPPGTASGLFPANSATVHVQPIECDANARSLRDAAARTKNTESQWWGVTTGGHWRLTRLDVQRALRTGRAELLLRNSASESRSAEE